VELPRGDVEMRVRPFGEGVVRSRELAWVDVYVNGAFRRAVSVPLRVSAFAQVRVARTDLAGDRELRAGDFEMRRVDVAKLGGEPAPPEAADRRLRRALRQGTVLMAGDLEARPAVARGEVVTLRFDSPMVRIETRVVALSDAAVGQPLWVRREAGGESLRARVVSPGNVEVASQ
ncbi:MAG TPA: flagellar basal body P-ring formation chaperone FlgA, partial [Usitatibacter sp.]|nr:flagellar basal body P-ring formation chaperone FlgA [Usitatibacter sp.]